MRPFTYERPTSLGQALESLSNHGTDARLLAGGTDLIVGLSDGKIRPRVVLDIKGMSDLRPSIGISNGRLAIAAPTVLADVIRDKHVQTYFPALVEAARTVGSVQIRNRATLTGNICNASPAADTAPALLVYAADVVLLSPEGIRRLPLKDFIRGPRSTALGPVELAIAIELPVPREATGSAFSRLTRRRGVDLATISLCCSVDVSGTTRFAFGAVAPKPILQVDATGVLADADADPEQRSSVLDSMLEHTTPITDVRASRDYRAAMLRVLSRRLLQSAIDRLPDGEPDV